MSLREAATMALEALEIARMNGKAGLYPAEIEEIADAITDSAPRWQSLSASR